MRGSYEGRSEDTYDRTSALKEPGQEQRGLRVALRSGQREERIQCLTFFKNVFIYLLI